MCAYPSTPSLFISAYHLTLHPFAHLEQLVLLALQPVHHELLPVVPPLAPALGGGRHIQLNLHPAGWVALLSASPTLLGGP